MMEAARIAELEPKNPRIQALHEQSQEQIALLVALETVFAGRPLIPEFV